MERREVNEEVLEIQIEESLSTHRITIVDQTILPDQIKIMSKLLLVPVAIVSEFLEHGTQVHWVLDDVVIIWSFSLGDSRQERSRMLLENAIESEEEMKKI